MEKYPPVVKEIKDTLVAHFGTNLHALLLYGSSVTQKEYWDLDLMVLLKEKTSATDDLTFLRTIFSQYSTTSLDLQLFYLNEVQTPDTFSLDAHGAFFVSVLANAEVLFGENPFLHHTPSEQLVIISLLNRIQRYIFQARQEYLGIGRHNKDKNPKYHQKHLRRTILDLMLMVGPCADANEAVRLFKEEFPNAFTATQYHAIEHASGAIENYIELYEKVYELALETAHKKLTYLQEIHIQDMHVLVPQNQLP